MPAAVEELLHRDREAVALVGQVDEVPMKVEAEARAESEVDLAARVPQDQVPVAVDSAGTVCGCHLECLAELPGGHHHVQVRVATSRAAVGHFGQERALDYDPGHPGFVEGPALLEQKPEQGHVGEIVGGDLSEQSCPRAVREQGRDRLAGRAGHPLRDREVDHFFLAGTVDEPPEEFLVAGSTGGAHGCHQGLPRI